MDNIEKKIKAAYELGDPTVTLSTRDLNDYLMSYYAEQRVIDDTLDMVGAPQYNDTHESPRIARVKMLAAQRDKALGELEALKLSFSFVKAAQGVYLSRIEEKLDRLPELLEALEGSDTGSHT
jgi:hypothetical protein